MNNMKKFLFLVFIILLSSCKSYDISQNKIDLQDSKLESPKIKPNKINKGDTIGLIAPGSYISERQLNNSVENLNKLGYKVKYNPEIMAKHGYLAGEDSVRVKQIHSMFLDDEVKAIMAVRGGYGCSRLLPYLDYEMIKNHPKILVGYSDITSLLYGIYKKTKLVCFHGPVATSTFNEYSLKNFENILTINQNNYVMQNLAEDKDTLNVINPGVAKGELVGGNLSIVVSLIGTEYDIDTKNKIIFLEDIGEEPYRIDRMLTQMKLSGKFENCAGIALGIFRRCEIDPNDPEFENSLTLYQVFKDRLGDLGIPVISGLSFGHITNKFTLPFGISAQLDTYNAKLTLLENSVN